MAQESFIEFYEQYLPKNEAARQKLESSSDEEVFVKNAVQLGKEHGFQFTEEDVISVMAVAEKSIALAGRKHPKTVRIRSLASVNALQTDRLRDTTACCW